MGCHIGAWSLAAGTDNLFDETYAVADFCGPEVVAGVIAMLASEDGAHINGEDIRVDGATLS